MANGLWCGRGKSCCGMVYGLNYFENVGFGFGFWAMIREKVGGEKLP